MVEIQSSDQANANESISTPPTHIKISRDPIDNKRKWWWLVASVVAVLCVFAATISYILGQNSATSLTQSSAANSPNKPKASTSYSETQELSLDTAKHYGDKYLNGLLPVGDGRYTTSGPKQGYVYACSSYATNLNQGQAGASSRGPWFKNNNTEYDINSKVHVSGSVAWHGSFSNIVSGSNQVIATNDLPDHLTGIFPIATNDSAYIYDRNPNSIKTQSLTYTLPLNPNYGAANCMGGEVGVMLTGVALFNAFDAGGRDAGAWEVQDSCNGHPQLEGEYHYHTLSSCIKDISVATVIGFALDGFPITGPTIAPGNILTTADLDECHGISSRINLNGKNVTMYHYVMTEDFPYSVSCFRSQSSQPISSAGTQRQSQNKTSGPPSTPPSQYGNE